MARALLLRLVVLQKSPKEKAVTERAQGETQGVDQVPTEAGDQDPASRAPESDGPMTQPVDPDAANQDMGESPDAAYGQREGQAEGK
jgi:hypothetical protein